VSRISNLNSDVDSLIHVLRDRYLQYLLLKVGIINRCLGLLGYNSGQT